MTKRMMIEVRGKSKSWLFHFDGDTSHLDEWRSDGLEINVIENSIPAWIVQLGVARVWCFLQDLFNFKNPWRK